MPSRPDLVDVDFVAPRHLAGGGDPAWVTVPLHRACGWSHGNDPLMPRVLLSSPDQRALLRLEPANGLQWWALHHTAGQGRPAWHMTFGGQTPVETVAAVTDALTDPATSLATDTDPYQPLLDAGWKPARGADGIFSPDGKVQFEHIVTEASDVWLATTTLGPSQKPLWQAMFREHTPPVLISAFTRALADTSPVPRQYLSLTDPAYGTRLISHTQRELPAQQVASALENRVRDLAERRPTPPTPLRQPSQSPQAGPRRLR
ncbi:DUF317 domain-containing protein [Streptomyces sp. NPDC056987]|uniref:DUF317 domain-containing protein n=1 Tax=Streptomyces sp. NPDC056987 TaxID=3345988 RepID=UPI003643CEB0